MINNNITEDYVSLEIAKLLKEKGFDIYCNYFYSPTGTFCGDLVQRRYKDLFYGEVYAPTIQLAVKWVYENFNIWIEVGYGCHPKGFYWIVDDVITVKSYHSETNAFQPVFSLQQEAYLAGLEYTLENLI